MPEKQAGVIFFRNDKMKTQIHIIKCRIIRKISKYNKYIKWFTECFRDDGTLLSSSGYRTRKEAENELTDDKIGIPIGNRIIKTRYELIP